MSQIKALFELDIVSVIIGVFIILLATKEIITLIQFFLKQFGIHTKIDDEKVKMENRFKKLESHDDWQYNKINEMSDNMDNVVKTLHMMDIEQKERTVASYRSTLYRLHKEFVAQKYVTTEGLKTFVEIGKIYEASGGDDIYHSKLYPEVMDLPIKD